MAPAGQQRKTQDGVFYRILTGLGKTKCYLFVTLQFPLFLAFPVLCDARKRWSRD